MTGDYRGRDEIVGTWLPELGTYEDSTSEDVRFLDAGDHVVVLGREAATVNGHRIANAFCDVWRFDGQLEEAWFFGDGAQTARVMDGALGTSA